MGELQFDTLSNDADQIIQIDMDTMYLVRTYGQFFTEKSIDAKDFYIENPFSKTQFRSYRYVASIATTETPHLPIQNLVKLYSPEGNIWEKELNDIDMGKIEGATTSIKISADSARRGDAPINMSRGITLTDGSNINVEYVPYTEEKTDEILNDMNKHLDLDIVE